MHYTMQKGTVMVRKNLRTTRQGKQLTQNEIAQQIKISIRQYKALEAGTSDGSIKVWYKLKTLLDKPIDYLLEQEDDADENGGKYEH